LPYHVLDGYVTHVDSSILVLTMSPAVLFCPPTTVPRCPPETFSYFNICNTLPVLQRYSCTLWDEVDESSIKNRGSVALALPVPSSERFANFISLCVKAHMLPPTAYSDLAAIFCSSGHVALSTVGSDWNPSLLNSTTSVPDVTAASTSRGKRQMSILSPLQA